MTPIRYRLNLAPDLAAGTFAGEAAIDLALASTTETIELDCLDLDIAAAWVDDTPAAWRLDGEKLIVTPATAPGDAATVRLTYSGRLSDTARGLYRGDGFIASQLQPDHARRLFPCLDAPALRAVFELGVTVPPGWTAVSNAAVGRRDALTTRFAPTPPLPTHLMAIALGAFQTSTEGEVGLHTLAPGPNDAWVLQTAVAALAFFSDWLGVPYPFGKLDLVLLPQVGAAGMENTGAIFLRAGAVAGPTREAATLIAHEIAHQWFGGLVTPAGWEDLWLNEGFATFLAPKAVAAIAPDLSDAAAETRQMREALHVDWAPTGRPLRQPAATSGEIAELFDLIAYRKGAGLLRTLEGWLGEAVFRRGLQLYLERHAQGVTTSPDFWAALEAASGQPVATVAEPLTGRAGAPAVRLDWRDGTLDITREDKGGGPLPLRLRIGLVDGPVVTRELLLDGVAQIALDAPIAWAFANPDAATYVRTLPAAARPPFDTLTDAEATVLLEDSWLSLWIGETDLLACLDLIADAGGAGLALDSARNHLREIGDLLAGGARRAPFDRWRAAIPNLALAPEPKVEALLAEFAAGGEQESLIVDLSALRDPAARPHQLALLADPALSAAGAQLACESLLGNSAATVEVWAWLKTNWGAVGDRLVGWGGRGAVAGLAAFSDPAMALDIAAFFAGRTPPGAERTLEASLARIAGRAHFRQRWQTSMDCLLMRSAAGAEPPARLQEERRRLGLLAAGFGGALLQRRLLDQQGPPPPPWMHTAENLQAALAAVERQLIQAWGGATPAAGNLAQSVVDDLTAAADHLERLGRKLADGDAAIWRQAVAAFARGRATQDRLRDEAILLAALSGDRHGADRMRAEAMARPPVTPDIDLFAAAPNRRQRLALKTAAADIPDQLRALAADLAAASPP